MQNFFFCFFQGFSSFSLRLRFSLAIQRRLLLWTTNSNRYLARPIALAGSSSLPLHLRRGPLQAGPDLLVLGLRIAGQIADDHDLIVLGHLHHPSSHTRLPADGLAGRREVPGPARHAGGHTQAAGRTTTLNRTTSSAKASTRSSSFTASGSAWSSTTR